MLPWSGTAKSTCKTSSWSEFTHHHFILYTTQLSKLLVSCTHFIKHLSSYFSLVFKMTKIFWIPIIVFICYILNLYLRTKDYQFSFSNLLTLSKKHAGTLLFSFSILVRPPDGLSLYWNWGSDKFDWVTSIRWRGLAVWGIFLDKAKGFSCGRRVGGFGGGPLRNPEKFSIFFY